MRQSEGAEWPETQRESWASPLQDGWDCKPCHQPHMLREEPQRARDEPADEWVTVRVRNWGLDVAAMLWSMVGALFSSASPSASNNVSVLSTAHSKCRTGASSTGSSISRASTGPGLQHAASVGVAPGVKFTLKFAPSLPNIAGSLPSLLSALAGLLRCDSAQPSSNSNSNSSGKAQGMDARRSSLPRSMGEWEQKFEEGVERVVERQWWEWEQVTLRSEQQWHIVPHPLWKPS